MRRLVLIMILLALGVLFASSGEHYLNIASGMHARLENIRLAPDTEPVPEDEEFPVTTLISRTYALPFQTAELQVQSLEWNVFDLSGNYLYTEQNRSINALSVGNVFKFREMQGFTVLIETQYQEGQNIRCLKNAEFSLQGSLPIELPASVSPAFIDAYKELADNYETSYLRDLAVARPKMLMISHNNLANYQTAFVNWKKAQGFDVYVVNKSDIGTTLTQFKQFILNHYNQYHCDYLLLLGDVDGYGSYTIPTAFYPSPEYAENDADDHQYTLLEGDDYFPEMLVGRLSFNDISEFMTMANKTVTYEKSPSMANTNWMTRGLAVAGNYAEGGLRPITPVQMSRWLRNKMLDYGYATVDTVFYPPTYPGTSSIVSSINQGVQFISYRGWGDANGWHYPSFHNPDLNSTNNGPRMPVVFSIVCNTGDFANSVNPSFGEKWMRMGSVAQPNGCVAFVGPSDLHTKTRLNNSISSGAFRSIFDYGVRGFASSVLMGKIELYKNFPNEIAPNQYVAFYYHVYNIQADPSLNMWVLVPQVLGDNIVNEGMPDFAQSDSHIRVSAANLEGAIVSGTKNGTDFTYAKVENGFAILPIDPEQTGDLTVTVSKPNVVPLVKTLFPNTMAHIGIVSNNAAGMTLIPNQTFNASITLKNYHDLTLAVNDLAIEASENATVNYQHSVFTIAPGATHEISFTITGGPGIQPRDPITISLYSDQVIDQVFQMYGGGAEFLVLESTGSIGIGQTSPVSFLLYNYGSQLTNAYIQAVSLTEAATFSPDPVFINLFDSGTSYPINTMVTVGSEAWEGRNLPLKLVVTGNGYTNTVFYSLTIGTPATTSPTGPDEYGYFAYDSFDAGFSQTPTYNWIETDPLQGGQGTVWEVMDDGSHIIDLPFTFKFYGRNYNQLTMCSNGWISLLPTDMEDFYNCYIPAALGPYAMIAGYWDDLKGMKTGVDGEGNGIFDDMRLIHWYDAANNRFVVSWYEAYNQYNIDLMDGASLEKFQIILYPQADRDGDIVIQYHTVDNPGTTTNYCTVGIENHSQTVGLGYTHGNVYPPTATPLQAGLAIKFTTIPPDNYVANDDQLISVPFQLAQNYPNPFNPSTTISFSTKISGPARLTVYNMKGQVVRTLLEGEVHKGEHSYVWNGKDDSGDRVSSGLYLYRLDCNGKSQTRKMLLMK